MQLAAATCCCIQVARLVFWLACEGLATAADVEPLHASL
jgi:hypothetical protein